MTLHLASAASDSDFIQDKPGTDRPHLSPGKVAGESHSHLPPTNTLCAGVILESSLRRSLRLCLQPLRGAPWRPASTWRSPHNGPGQMCSLRRSSTSPAPFLGHLSLICLSKGTKTIL